MWFSLHILSYTYIYFVMRKIQNEKHSPSSIICIGIFTYVYWQFDTQRLWIWVIPISKPFIIIYSYALMQYRYSKTDEAFDHKKSWLHSSLNTSKSSAIFGLIINILETFKRTRHNLLLFLQFSEKVHFNVFDEGYINLVCPL